MSGGGREGGGNVFYYLRNIDSEAVEGGLQSVVCGGHNNIPTRS